jgi:hypothetical protein
MERIIPEIRFDKLTVVTDKFELSLEIKRKKHVEQVMPNGKSGMRVRQTSLIVRATRLSKPAESCNSEGQ